MTTAKFTSTRQRALGRCQRRSGSYLFFLVPAHRTRRRRAEAPSAMSPYVLWPRWLHHANRCQTAPAHHRCGCRIQPAARCDPRGSPAPAGAQERVDLVFLWPSLQTTRSRLQATHPAGHGAGVLTNVSARIHDHRRRRRYARPCRARANHLSALYRSRATARPGRTCRARIPRRHALCRART